MVLVAGTVVGCGGAAGNAARPKDFQGAEALGKKRDCSSTPSLERTLTVDLESDQRTDVEAALSGGLAVVSYDCKSFRVLNNCRLADAGYAYVGVSRKEETVQLTSTDDVSATLPLSVGKFGGEVHSGRALDLALVTVGRRSTTVSRVAPSQLEGDCEGATHFVSRAFIGAFAMKTGSVGNAAAAADVFGVGSASGKSTSERKASAIDGSLEACRAGDSKGAEPPKECEVPVRLELTPFTKQATAAATKPPEGRPLPPPVDAPACEAGYHDVNGICTQSASLAFLCDPKNRAECEAQCSKGSAGSCFNAGTHIVEHAENRPEAWEKANAEARPFFEKGCSAGHVEACGALARVSFPLALSPKNLDVARKVIAQAKTACDAGSVVACGDLGHWLAWNGGDDAVDTALVDDQASLRASERACALGGYLECATAAEAYSSKTFGLKKLNVHDPKRAVELWNAGCVGGAAFVCTLLTEWLATGKDGVVKDVPRAVRAGERACGLDPELCATVAPLLERAGRKDVADRLRSQGK
jgi:TPR repeat protein